MVTNWVIAAGVVTVCGIIGMLIHRSGMAGSDVVTPWEGYHKALVDAESARAQFLQDKFSRAGKRLKDRICDQMRKCHFRFCPLCC